MNKIIIIGSGGHAKSCIEIIKNHAKYDVFGLIDDNRRIGENVLGHKVIGTTKDIIKFINKVRYFHIGIGHVKDNKKRIYYYKLLKSLNAVLPNIISKNSVVSNYIKIGDGNIIMNNVCINADVTIGNNNIINTSSVIEHDCVLGNHSHISTSVTVNGSVKIQDSCFIGSGSVISNNLKIKKNSFVKLSSKIVRNI